MWTSMLMFFIASLLTANFSMAYSVVDTSDYNKEIDWSAGSKDKPLQFTNIFGQNDREMIQLDNIIGMRVKTKIGKLISPDGDLCTGSLVWKNLVLTSAHCIAGANKKQIQKGTYRFCIEYRNDVCTAESDVSRIWYGSLDPDTLGRQHDWAILKLEKPLGDEFGYFGWKNPSSELEHVYLAGYGGQFYGGQFLSISNSCRLMGSYREGKLIAHDCDSSRGDSGGPIFICTEDDCRIVALNAGEERYESETSLSKPEFTWEFKNIAIAPNQFSSELIRLKRENP